MTNTEFWYGYPEDWFDIPMPMEMFFDCNVEEEASAARFVDTAKDEMADDVRGGEG